MGESDDGNPTPHQGIRIPKPMWEAFRRVCERRGIDSRTERLRAMIRSDIRRYGDAQDKADLAAADGELKIRRSRRPPAAA